MNKKILIFGVAGLVLLAGGGGGAYYMFGMAKTPEHKAEPVEVKPAPIFVQMDQLSVPVLQGDRVSAYYFIQVSLQVASEAKRIALVERMPLIKDAFVRDVYRHSAMRADVPDSLDFDALKLRFMNLSTQILGSGAVEDVLITRAIRAVG